MSYRAVIQNEQQLVDWLIDWLKNLSEENCRGSGTVSWQYRFAGTKSTKRHYPKKALHLFTLETFYNSYNIEKHTGRKQYSEGKIAIKEGRGTKKWIKQKQNIVCSRRGKVEKGFDYSQFRVAASWRWLLRAVLKDIRDLLSFMAVGREFHMLVV